MLSVVYRVSVIVNDLLHLQQPTDPKIKKKKMRRVEFTRVYCLISAAEEKQTTKTELV